MHVARPHLYTLCLPFCRKASTDGSVSLEELTLATPHGELTVCKELSLKLAPGQSLLIVGPSGVGKTSIMRAVAGGVTPVAGASQGRQACHCC